MNTLAVCCLSLGLAEPFPSPLGSVALDAGAAEALADCWWSAWYRQGRGFGAAWVDHDGMCRVGLCDGRASHPGKGGKVVGRPGAWRNACWEAVHRSPSGAYYKNHAWFGVGRTWREAFLDALSRGHAPVGTDRQPDHAEARRFTKEVPP